MNYAIGAIIIIFVIMFIRSGEEDKKSNEKNKKIL